MSWEGQQRYLGQCVAGFQFSGMTWEGTGAEIDRHQTPNVANAGVFGAMTRLSLGEEWGRDLEPEVYGAVFVRRVHDEIVGGNRTPCCACGFSPI